MKNILYILSLTALGYTGQPIQSAETVVADTTEYCDKSKDRSEYHTTQDSVFIATYFGETLKYSKEEFNMIVDNNPVFLTEYTRDPDQTHECNASDMRFLGEAGQDEYYVLYAYFLQQRNGIDEYAQRRKTLIDIFFNTNSLFSHLNHGGTYFGHQSYRILGYVEYAIYLLKENKYYEIYDITKQKAFYIESLRQLILDKIEADDFSFSAEAKEKRIEDINEYVDELDKLITDIFYLRQAQEFHYRHYL